MTKKIVVFDLDDTLAVTKSPIEDRMGELLAKLLNKYDVCIISGGKFEQFKIQVIDRLEVSAQQLSRLHIMPTCGTRYYRYDQLKTDWSLQYAEDLTDKEKLDSQKALEKCAKELGYWEEKPYGDIIEDRGSQITFSAIGQKAPAEEKYKWDPTGEKKKRLRDTVAKLIPSLEVRVGGTTSIDITRIGIDKGYGMRKLMSALEIGIDEILFVGDKLQEGGNDYPVKAVGIDCIEVDRWQDTALVVEGIIVVS